MGLPGLLAALTASLTLLGPAHGTGAEPSRLVKADVFVTGGFRAFRHQVTVKSKDPERRILSVLVGELPGLPERPVSLQVPSAWEGRVLERMRPGWTAWAVEVVCQGEDCGLRAGESLQFEFQLPYAAESLAREPIFLSYTDGRTGIASR